MKDVVSVQSSKHPRYAWKITWREGKKRRQRYLRTRDEANAEAITVRKRILADGNAQAGITEEEKLAVWTVRVLAKELEDRGMSFSLKAAVDHYAGHLRSLHSSTTVEDAVKRYLAFKTAEKKSARYLSDLRVRLAKFKVGREKIIMAAVTSEDVDSFLEGRGSPQTTKNFRTILHGLFAWAKKKNLTNSNPVQAASKQKVIKPEVGVLTPEEAADLLNACDAETLGPVLLGLFAGVRNEELHRMSWEQVKLGEGEEPGTVEIKAVGAKSAKRRLIPIRPNLAQWLGTIEEAKRVGPLIPSPGRYRNRLVAAVRKAGVIWKSNCLRHSFVSYAIEAEGNASGLALELGHSTTSMIFAHYRTVVTKPAAKKFWQIYPRLEAGS